MDNRRLQSPKLLQQTRIGSITNLNEEEGLVMKRRCQLDGSSGKGSMPEESSSTRRFFNVIHDSDDEVTQLIIGTVRYRSSVPANIKKLVGDGKISTT
ncbi:hypothetical protein Tco_1212961 [Tanacetum coccineum]